MSIDPNKYCGGHTKKKEETGECCQIGAQQRAEQDTYEYNTKIGPKPKETNE